MDFVENVMTKKVVTCKPSETILDVQGLMVKNRISRVVVADAKNKPVGIITQRDVVRFLIADETRRGIDEMKAEEVMSKKLVTAKSKTSIPDVAKTMVKKDISSLVIVDNSGKLKGIITKADLIACCGQKGTGMYKVNGFMTKKPVTVRASQPMFLAASLMADHEISRVIVVDRENKPIGIITLADVTMVANLLKPARVLKEGKPVVVKGLITLPKNMYLLTCGDIMTADPISINEDADLAEAAKLMAKHGISGLPVTGIRGKLAGIITKSDITKAIATAKK